ncbi:MAG: hypothetical protein F6K07_33090, partial [Okeania sp. SIO1H5]|uniref:hypothetical protein n=1 Tax=Okeania sp. SIO1H5 TaxID=2607777 RepID=UPI0013BC225C
MAMKTGISYFGVRDVDHARKDMQEIANHGFTHVLHTLSEEDLQYHADSLREIVSISKDLGLGVYLNPWGVGRVFGGEAYSELAARNPQQAQIDNKGKPTVASCINHPMFQE